MKTVGYWAAGLITLIVGIAQITLFPVIGLWSLSVPFAASAIAALIWMSGASAPYGENAEVCVRACAIANCFVGVALVLAKVSM